jgi:hypothetical protein
MGVGHVRSGKEKGTPMGGLSFWLTRVYRSDNGSYQYWLFRQQVVRYHFGT